MPCVSENKPIFCKGILFIENKIKCLNLIDSEKKIHFKQHCFAISQKLHLLHRQAQLEILFPHAGIEQRLLKD